MKKVAVIMGSDSDWPVVKGACTQLDALDIPYEDVQPYIAGRLQACAHA